MASIHYTKIVPDIVSEDEYGDIPVRMSDNIYYKVFPYKLEFDNLQFDNWRNLRNFHREIEDFVDDFEIYSHRRYLSKHKQFIYLKKKIDIDKFVNMYHSIIKTIYGPMNKEHLDFLYDKNVEIDISNSLYYGKYDCKIIGKRTSDGYTDSFIWTLNMNNGFRTRHSELAEFISEAIDFLRENLSEFRYVSDRPYQTNFFCNYAEFKEILPLLKLQLPDLSYFITKRLVQDK